MKTPTESPDRQGGDPKPHPRPPVGHASACGGLQSAQPLPTPRKPRPSGGGPKAPPPSTRRTGFSLWRTSVRPTTPHPPKAPTVREGDPKPRKPFTQTGTTPPNPNHEIIPPMDRLKSAVDKILGRLPNARGRGEEATKQSLVLPLLDALGYDIGNPAEVCPEYEADFAIKKYGQKEKVDLAVFLQDVPRIYVEVKSVDEPLDGHEGQLSRYFNATPTVSLAVLTNGIEYRFFTDTAEANVMDPRPFHTARFDALDQGLEVLARFQKSVFSPEAIREYARELNFTARIVDFLRDKLDLRDRDPLAIRVLD